MRWCAALVGGVLVLGASAASAGVVSDPPTGVSGVPPVSKLSDPTARGVGWGGPVGFAALGDGTSLQRLSPVLIDGGSLLDDKVVSDVEPGPSSSCALAVGRVYCWGANGNGQLGNGALASAESPVLVGGLLTGLKVTAISVGGSHACAIASFHVYCWGSNFSGQLGIGDDSLVSSATPLAVDPAGLLAGKRVTSVSAGFNHTCVVAAARAYCWGDNSASEIGDGTNVERNVPTAVAFPPGAGPVDSISAGATLSCAIIAGRASCWGLNGHGQVGGGSLLPPVVASPTDVYAGGVLKDLKVTSISAGIDLVCATAGSGATRRAFCWGQGGHLGINSDTDAFVPVAVSATGVLKGKPVSSVSAYGSGACVVTEGQGACWGDDDHGQFGDGSTNSNPLPTATDTTGILESRRLLVIGTGLRYTTGVAVSPKVFSDVPKGYVFEDDI
ncbi:hypothetical protein D1871_10915, partial [Nakamurella silvestris]